MCVGPAWWVAAAGEGAAAVSEHQASAQRSGEQPAGLSDVENLPLAAQHGGQDLGVAGEAADLGGGEEVPGVQGPGADLPAEGFEVDDDVDLRAVTAVDG